MINKRGVMFLDYDGVVNNIIWDLDKLKANYNFPRDGKVNDAQAVQWVSQICEDFGYDVVVTSTWRRQSNYANFLYHAGFRGGSVIGRTDFNGPTRGIEILRYLFEHPEITEYVIIDDEIHDFYRHDELKNNFYKVTGDGFYYTAFCEVSQLIKNMPANDQLECQSNKISTEHDRGE